MSNFWRTQTAFWGAAEGGAPPVLPITIIFCYKIYMGTCRIIRRVFSYLFEVKIIKTEGVIPCTHFQRVIFLTLSILRIVSWFLYLHLEENYTNILQQKSWKNIKNWASNRSRKNLGILSKKMTRSSNCMNTENSSKITSWDFKPQLKTSA